MEKTSGHSIHCRHIVRLTDTNVYFNRTRTQTNSSTNRIKLWQFTRVRLLRVYAYLPLERNKVN